MPHAVDSWPSASRSSRANGSPVSFKNWRAAAELSSYTIPYNSAFRERAISASNAASARQGVHQDAQTLMTLTCPARRSADVKRFAVRSSAGSTTIGAGLPMSGERPVPGTGAGRLRKKIATISMSARPGTRKNSRLMPSVAFFPFPFCAAAERLRSTREG